MENLEFVIPANKEELLERSSGFYYITDVIPLNHLTDNLRSKCNLSLTLLKEL